MVQMAKVRPLLLMLSPLGHPRWAHSRLQLQVLAPYAAALSLRSCLSCVPVATTLTMCSGALSPICVLLALCRVPLVLQFPVPHSEKE